MNIYTRHKLHMVYHIAYNKHDMRQTPCCLAYVIQLYCMHTHTSFLFAYHIASNAGLSWCMQNAVRHFVMYMYTLCIYIEREREGESAFVFYIGHCEDTVYSIASYDMVYSHLTS